LIVGITSCQSSVSALLVKVIKLLAINTLLIKGKLNNSFAKGEAIACASSDISILFQGYNNLLATNLFVFGLGFISV